MSRFKTLREYLSFNEALKIYWYLKRGNTNGLSISSLQHPFTLRRNNFYDYATFEEVILKKAYNVAIDFIPQTIIDAGANIGLTSAYFATKFPNANIISLEPDAENFGLLKKNTSLYPNVHPLQAGLWNKTTQLVVEDAGLGNNAFTVREVTEFTEKSIPSYSIPHLMQVNKWTVIDLLKIDVEGSEKEIFSEGFYSWLPSTRLLIIELHDRSKKGCSKAVFSALNQYDFSFEIAGENLIFKNENLVHFNQ